MKNEEADEVSAVYAHSWRAAYRGIVPQDFLDTLPDNRWSSLLTGGGFSSLVLLDNGRIVGTAAYGRARDAAFPEWGEVISLYLLPEYFGRGCGQMLLSRAVDALNQEGYKSIYLWVLRDNSRARRFYEKNGFECTDDTLVCDVGGKALTDIKYVYKA